MQKCGQLQASIAVALIAQSAVGEEVWPADTPSRAMTSNKGTLRIRVTSFCAELCAEKGLFARSNRRLADPMVGAFLFPAELDCAPRAGTTSGWHRHHLPTLRHTNDNATPAAARASARAGKRSCKQWDGPVPGSSHRAIGT